MGTSPTFNSYPLGDIFQYHDKISIPNHRAQWFGTSIPNWYLLWKQTKKCNQLPQFVITKENLSIDASDLLSHA